MDKLQECAKAFENLLDFKYRIVLGRKNTSITLNIIFTKWDFHHLMGLGKLKDLRVARAHRGDVFDKIISGNIDYSKISLSRHIDEIEDRFTPLSQMDKILDRNNLIFRYNEKSNMLSLIQADFLLSTPFNGTDVYIFLSKHEAVDNYFCRSFFPKSTKDYTEGQKKYTLLYKEKINLLTGESEVQYNRMRT